MTEIDASTGGLVQVLSGPSYDLGRPKATSSEGTDVWFANLAPERSLG